MLLAQQLREYIAACFTGIWIESHEHDDALTEIGRLCHDEEWRLARWNIAEGLQVPGTDIETGGSDPLAAIRAVNSLATPEGTAILVLQNFHRFLQSAEIVQALVQQITSGKQNRSFVVILAPVVQIPTELEKLMIVMEHELPSREQLAEIARGVATEQGELPNDADMAAVLDASAGLTRYEAEGAFSLALVRHGALRPNEIWELKSQVLKKSGLLSLHIGSERFADLGGLEALKSFCLRAMRRQNNSDPLRRPRGMMLLSPPGCGKSQFAKSLGNETGRPTLILDIGRLMGSLVGESEQRTRQALRSIDAMAPCVAMLDEVEKALAGAGGGQGDSGVASRMFGTLLTWLNDRQSDVFVVCTCNDISKLPPEFARSWRFDGVFFVDLPTAEQRKAIWDIYIPMFGLDPQQLRPKDDNYTGAEIRSCCRLAALLDVPLTAAAQNVVPVAVTAAESVERLRNWASGRCLDATQAGVYQREGGLKRCRKISADPLSN